MNRKCKPGIRARFVQGSNTGAVVLVVRRYFGEEVSGAEWPRVLLPWVVTSLGKPLRSTYLHTGEEAPPATTIVADDRDLEPLRDEDEDDSIKEQIARPRGLGQTVTTGQR